MRAWLAGLCLGLVGLEAVAAVDIPNRRVVLQGLDKVTARIQRFEAPVGVPTEFGNLVITPRACYESPPTEAPESAAFLEIVAIDYDRSEETLFSGWMFASSPGLSPLEHPVYDVWVLDCVDPVDPSPPPGNDRIGDETKPSANE